MNYMGIVLKIQNNLEEYRKIVEVFEKEDIEDFSVIALKGTVVCESMLELILALKGIRVDQGMVIFDDDMQKNGIHTPRHITPLGYCIFEKDIVPDECRNFLNLIRNYRNQAAHISNLDKKMIIEFSRALDYFTAWFSKQYINESVIGTVFAKVKDRFFSIENILSKEDEVVQAHSSDAELIRQLLQKIDTQTDIIVNLTKQVNRIDERSERIEDTVNEIDRKLDELAAQINAYQSLVERQIEKADSDIEIDRIIQGYTDECVERIVKATNSGAEKRALDIERKKLIASIGTAAWDKLDDASKTFLVSAKIMYNHLILLDDQTDYSGVCVLITKAIEVEMSKRFYARFLSYLDVTYKKDYSQYHTALLFNGSKPLKPEKFTMGSIAFAMCYLEDKYDSPAQRKQNKELLIEYTRVKLFPGKSDVEISKLLDEYAAAIEAIRIDYRNPSAHTDQLHQVDAEQCFNLVLDVEKLLKRMLDSFYE